MNDFTFQNTTKVLFGRHQLDAFVAEVAAAGERALLVYGGGSVKRTGVYDQVAGALHAAGVQTFDLAGVEPNPRHTTVNRGAAIVRENGIDSVLAIGGGSAIDCAKGVSALVPAATDDVWDIVEKRVEVGDTLPVFAVVTIAATGSEMDASAVISNMDKNVKSGFYSRGVRPRAALENPEYTFTVPRYQTACGSVDIMSHVMDVSYFSAEDRMDMLRRVQEDVMATVYKYAPVAFEEPENYEARANLMWAASWALNSFTTCGIRQHTVAHAMEHELSAHYDITHGHGLAILIPHWMEHMLAQDEAVVAPVFARFGERVLGLAPSGDASADARAAIAALREFFFTTLGLASRLSELGIDDEKFALMAAAACDAKGGRLHGLTDLTAADVEAIYRAAL